jgi:hypothetical protein
MRTLLFTSILRFSGCIDIIRYRPCPAVALHSLAFLNVGACYFALGGAYGTGCRPENPFHHSLFVLVAFRPVLSADWLKRYTACIFLCFARGRLSLTTSDAETNVTFFQVSSYVHAEYNLAGVEPLILGSTGVPNVWHPKKIIN